MDKMEKPPQLSLIEKGSDRDNKLRPFIGSSLASKLALVFIAGVIALTYIALERIESDARKDAAASLQTVLTTTVETTRLWVEKREHHSHILGASPYLLKFTKELLSSTRDREALLASPALTRARKYFEPTLQKFHDLGFFIISPDYINIASLRDANIGKKNLIAIQEKDLFDKVFKGQFTLIPPIISDVPLTDSSGELVENHPTMFVASPIKDENGSTIAALTFRVDPSKGFSDIAQLGRIGATGETYFFDRTGTLISESRFDDHLRAMGLIEEEQRGILSIEIRDPGVNMVEGHVPKNPRHEQPLTLMAKSATAGESGVNMDGYRDYRGVRVLGAWHWYDELGIGVTTEIDEAEALNSFYNLRAIIIFIASITVSLVAVLFVFLAWFLKQRKKTTWEKEENLKSLPLKLKRYAWTLLAGWTVIIITMFALEVGNISHNTSELSKNEARVHFEWIKLFRSWVASHGGVYVPVDDRTPPNEYLAQVTERDITTPSGRKLTLLNPAYMTRQVFEEFVKDINIEGHLTSLNPLRPENAPDEWEKTALEAFERGESEREMVTTINGLPYLRLMRPLYVKDACLQCHAHQGYETGDVYGGISASLPLTGYQATQRSEIFKRSLSHGLIWILGIAAIGFGERGLRRQIHERKVAEEALHEKARIIDMVNDSVVSTDLDGYMTSWNKGAERLFGYTAEEMMGKHISSLYPEEEHEFLQNEVIASLKKKGNHEAEVRMRKKSGEEFYGLLSLSMTRDKNGDASGMIGMTIDITERKRAEAELRKAHDELEEKVEDRTKELYEAIEIAESANQSKSLFLANMSHEIRTPMNAIMSLTQLCLKTDLSEKQLDYLEKTYSSAESLLGIINDILDFSKIEAGKLEMEHVPFELDDVLDNLITVNSIKAMEKGLELHIGYDLGMPMSFVGDPLRLGQVLTNIVNNAIKFTDSGEVNIYIRQVGHNGTQVTLKFEIQDTGIGMSEEQLKRLFQAFSQADSSTTRKYGGTGLGLKISKQLVEMMGGEVAVKSKPGTGTTFSFSLLLDIDAQNQSQSLPSAPDLGEMRVLVVDDSESSRLILGDFLKSLSFHVVCVGSGEECLDILRKEKFDVAILDWIMPELNGIETAKRIKKDDSIVSKPKVIMISAFGGKDVAMKLKGKYLDAYLSKPIRPSELLDSILTVHGKEFERKTKRKKRRSKEPDLALLKPVRGARILLVEDNAINQQIACEFLKEALFIVDVANHGKEAIEMLEHEHYDCVLMDIQMPIMDGYTATVNIRKDERFKDLPIIAMTANAMLSDQKLAIEKGMNAHLPKPINSAALFSELLKWIEHKNRDLPDRPDERQGNGNDNNHTLPRINGLDVEVAVNRMEGNVELFQNILSIFHDDHGNDIGKLRDAVEKNDLALARRLAHTLKGVAGTIGANDLEQAAKSLESAISENRSDNLQQLVQITDEAFGPLLADLSRFFTDKNGGDTGEAPFKASTAEEVATLFSELKSLIDEMDPGAEEKALMLAKSFGDEKFNGLPQLLAAQVGEFEFEKALATLNKLREAFEQASSL